jgi:hypothetical protein
MSSDAEQEMARMGFMDLLKGLLGGESSENLAETAAGSPEVYQDALARLLEADSRQFITIEQSGGEACLQVAKSGTNFVLLLATYPFSGPPDQKLAELGVTLPAGAILGEWAPAESAQYEVPLDKTAEVAKTIHSLFRQVFRCPDGYTVSIHMES